MEVILTMKNLMKKTVAFCLVMSLAFSTFVVADAAKKSLKPTVKATTQSVAKKTIKLKNKIPTVVVLKPPAVEPGEPPTSISKIIIS